MVQAKTILIAALQTLLLVLIPSDAVADEKERLFQFGLVPPVSSNGSNSGRTVNAISVNLIGGYSAGTRIFELGSVWNASREFTKGLQLAELVRAQLQFHTDKRCSQHCRIRRFSVTAGRSAECG